MIIFLVITNIDLGLSLPTDVVLTFLIDDHLVMEIIDKEYWV